MIEHSRHIVPTAVTHVEAPRIVRGGGYAIDLKSALKVLKRRKLTIFACMVALAFPVIAYKTLVPPQYTAGARILIDPSSLQVVERDVKPQTSSGSENFAFVESQMRVMTSDEVLGKVADELNLESDPEFGARPPSLTFTLREMLLGASPASEEPRVKAVRQLGDAVGIARSQNTYIVDLRIDSNSPEKAATIANAIAAAYVENEFDSRVRLAQRVSNDLSGRLEQLRIEVQQAEEEVERFARDNGIVQFANTSDAGDFSRDNIIAGTGGQLLSEQQMSAFSAELVRARAAASEAEARYRQIEQLRNGGLSIDNLTESVASETITQLRVQYVQVQQIADSLAQTFADGHPKLIEVRARADTVAHAIDDELERISQSAREAYERAQRNEDQLTSRLASLEDSHADTNEKLVRLRELQRSARASRVVYESFLVRYREVQEQTQIDTAVARVISPALRPERPSGPGTGVLLILALMFGAAAGGTLAYVQEQFDPKIRSPEQLTAVTGLALLGTVDLHSGRPNRFTSGCSLLDTSDMPAVVRHRPESAAATVIAKILQQLRNRPRATQRHRVLVTASGAGEGKSSIALNLALAAAAGGENVLLVDGDLTYQNLSRNCDRSGVSGLSDVVAGRASLSMALTEIPGTTVSLLGSIVWDHAKTTGPTPQDIARLMQSANMFRTIIVDGPPLGPDPWLHSFGQNVDNVIIVAREGNTDADLLVDGLAFFNDCAARPAGCVLVTA